MPEPRPVEEANEPNEPLRRDFSLLEETAKGAASFLGLVARFATSAEDIVQGLRLEKHEREAEIDFADYICQDLLQDDTITQQLFTDVLTGYLNEVPNDLYIVGFHETSYGRGQALRDQDPIARNISSYDFQINAWKSKLYHDKKANIDRVIADLETRLQTLIQQERRNTVEEVGSLFSADAFSLLLIEGMHVNGDLRGSLAVLKKKMYFAAAFEYKEDPELLYRLSFNACVKAKGWQTLEDKPLYEALEAEDVSVEVFEKWTGRKINYNPKPEAKQKTVADVIHAQGADPPRKASIALVHEFLPSQSTYAQGVHALRASYNGKEAEIPQHMLYRTSAGVRLIRPQTLEEAMLARINDFDTLQDSNGKQRTMEERLRLWDKLIDTCAGVAYENGNNEHFKLSSICEPLITIPQDFRNAFLDVNYAAFDGIQLARTAYYYKRLSEQEFDLCEAWQLLLPDQTARTRLKQIVYHQAKNQQEQLLIADNDKKALGFYLVNNSDRDQLRSVFVSSRNNYSDAYGVNLNGSSSVLRATPPSSKKF
ncbi:hypothetical protein HZA96_04640 [Candidatus Woesearchaeota archaeon]|nr:hypothetical protein [Candidatus Woesearchaeota archaeon]